MPQTDPVALIKTLLSANWASANVDSIVPSFFATDDREETKAHTLGKDLILLYTGRPMTRKRLDGRGDYATWEASVTVDVRTSGTSSVKPKAHGVKVLNEIERILNNKKQEPDTFWDFILIDSPATVESEYSTAYRFLVNVLLQRIGGAVPT